jgi:aromatic ring-opening dioxygenase LigB subunit
MVLVGAAVIPHAAMVLDPARPELHGRRAFADLNAACKAAADVVASTSPDLIVLHSPHALALSEHLGVYLAPSAAGSAEWLGSWSEFAVSVRLADDRAKQLIQHLKSSGVQAEGIVSFGAYDAPLRWAEAIPMHFVTEAMGGSLPGGRDETVPLPDSYGGPRWLILSEGIGGSFGTSSAERAEVSPAKVPSNIELGKNLGAWLDALPERAFFLSSGDESHCHGNSRCPTLPDGSADQRYVNPKYSDPRPMAAPFDSDIQEWLATLSCDALVSRARDKLPEALSCGFDGKVILHGMLGGGLATDGDTGRWVPRALHYGCPAYCGMVTAVWTPPPPRPPPLSDELRCQPSQPML